MGPSVLALSFDPAAPAATATFTASDIMDERPVYQPECDVPAILRRLAGPAARDCGHVAILGDRKLASACAVAELAAERPFFVLFETLGIDSHSATGFYSAGYGRFVVLNYDGYLWPVRLSAIPAVTPTPGARDEHATHLGTIDGGPHRLGDSQLRYLLAPDLSAPVCGG